MIENNDLDQFYTNPIVSDILVQIIRDTLPNEMKKNFLEPSAGTGNFIRSLLKIGVKKSKIKAYDLDPKFNEQNIIVKDYLKVKNRFSNKRIIIGNPPFGKRGKLALEFLNKALKEAPYVAMILPNIFSRYSIQKKIIKEAKLILRKTLEENSFILNDKEYGVKCVFQI